MRPETKQRQIGAHRQKEKGEQENENREGNNKGNHKTNPKESPAGGPPPQEGDPTRLDPVRTKVQLGSHRTTVFPPLIKISHLTLPSSQKKNKLKQNNLREKEHKSTYKRNKNKKTDGE